MRYLLMMAILVTFLGCKKGKTDFTIIGQVSDQTFGGVLTGSTVRLFEIEAGSLQETQIGTAVIDNSGSYSFTFPRDKAESYRLELSKANYFSIIKTVSFSSLSTDNDNVINLSSTAKSWVDLHFINNNPQITDELTFIKQDGKQGCEECCGTSTVYLYGAVDTVITCINDGNTDYSYLWILNGGSPAIESITTTPFDTVELLLTY